MKTETVELWLCRGFSIKQDKYVNLNLHSINCTCFILMMPQMYSLHIVI